VVARNQRERLLAATVAVVAEHGYEATRVADLVALSGVSRSAFYRHFDDKLDCYLATLDAIFALAREEIAPAYAEGHDRESSLRAAANRLVELIVDQPDTARVCLIEPYAAGPAALARLDGATAAAERMVRAAVSESPTRAELPRDVIRAIVGGMLKTVQTRLREDRGSELEQTASELLEWAFAYRTPAAPLRRPRARPSPRSEIGRDGDDGLTDAIGGVFAERGYQATTIVEMAQRAAISLTTFYARFASKEDAFLATLDGSLAQARATIRHARAGDASPAGVREAIDAFLGLLAADPSTARLLAVESYAAGPRAARSGDRLVEALAEVVEALASRQPRLPPTTAEAVGGAIQSLVYGHVVRQRAERLRELTPTATFVALAPYVGNAAATAAANDANRRR
jgi:AcrR family transcriptional regulator